MRERKIFLLCLCFVAMVLSSRVSGFVFIFAAHVHRIHPVIRSSVFKSEIPQAGTADVIFRPFQNTYRTWYISSYHQRNVTRSCEVFNLICDILTPGQYSSIQDFSKWRLESKNTTTNSRAAQRGPAFGRHDLTDALHARIIFPSQITDAYREYLDNMMDYLTCTEAISKKCTDNR